MTNRVAESKPAERRAQAENAHLVPADCPLCGSADHRPQLTAGDTTFNFPGPFDVVACNSCNTLFTNPRVPKEKIGDYFPTEYSAHDADRAKRHASDVRGRDPWDRLKPFGDATLLDVGCGSGAFLTRMVARGWTVTGVEPSGRAVEAARSAGHYVHHGTLDDFEPQKYRFNAVVMLGVLDHLYDPLSALRRIRTLVNDDAVVIASVPNAAGAAAKIFGASWPGWDLPRHQTHFTPNSLTTMFEKAGFEETKITTRKRTSHWRRGARLHAAATGRLYWRMIASSRNACGLLSRIYARGEMADDLAAVATVGNPVFTL